MVLLYGDSALRSDSWSINTFMPTSWSESRRDLFSWALLRSVSICLLSPILSSPLCKVCQITYPVQIAEPGEALSTVWYVERMAHDASCIYASMSLVITVWPYQIWRFWACSSVLDDSLQYCIRLWVLLLWLAYAWDHMNHIDLRNSVWIRFHCRVTALGLSTQPRVISDVIFVLMSYQRYSIFLDVNELAFDSACPRYCAYRGSSLFQTSF
jgi:hypothetical protein